MYRLNPLALAAALIVLAACTGKDPQSLLGSARDYLGKGDPKAAVIQLKTALQEAPDLAEARLLLGRALLASGDAAGAVVELRKAQELKLPDVAVAPELARAMASLGQHQQVVERFAHLPLPEPKAQADLQTTLAGSYASLGQFDRARSVVDEALRADAGSGRAQVLKLRLQAGSGDIDGALGGVAKLLADQPQLVDAWQLQGDLQRLGKQDSAAALASYRHAIALAPDHVPAHNAILTQLMTAGDLAAAKAQLEQFRKAAPQHPLVAYFAGFIALGEKKTDEAREIAQKLLLSAPNHIGVLHLAGAVEFERRAWPQAEVHLAKAVQNAPEAEASRLLLTRTYLALAKPAAALATLQPLLERARPGATVYALAAHAHAQAGDIDKAEAAFTQAAKLNPADTGSRAALAISKTLKGQVDTGVAELRALAAADAGTVADLALISTLVRKRDFAGAHKAIEALELKQPDQPVAANLQARVYALQGNWDAARKAWERALQIQPAFYPATAALVQLALRDGKADAARALVDAALQADPKNMQALLASAALKAQAGAARDEVVGLFVAASARDPADAAPRLALINYHLANKDFKLALEVARQANTALPNSAELLDGLGRAQAANGEWNQAASSFGKLAQLQPGSALPLLRLADVQWASKEREAAVQTLRRALAASPENLGVQVAIGDAYLALGRVDDALAVARTIQQQRPGEDRGFLIEGTIEAGRKRWDAAIDTFRKGLKAAPLSSALAQRLHMALLSAKRDVDASKHAGEWTRSHPSDGAFIFHLGNLALAKSDLVTAERKFREVLALQPENPLALNNVAWVMALSKKPGAAALAEQANRLLPNRPALMDTLALALAAEGEPRKAVEVYKKALALEPGNPQLRLSYAQALIQAGDRTAAKTELDALTALGSKFPRQAEVAALLKTL